MYYRYDLSRNGYDKTYTKKQLINSIVNWLCCNQTTPEVWCSNKKTLWTDCNIGASYNINYTGKDTWHMIEHISLEPDAYYIKDTIYPRRYEFYDENWTRIDIRNFYPEIRKTYYAYKAGLTDISDTTTVRRHRYHCRHSRHWAGFKRIHYKNYLVQMTIPEYKRYTAATPQHIRSPWFDDNTRSYSGDWKSNTKNRKSWAKHKGRIGKVTRKNLKTIYDDESIYDDLLESLYDDFDEYYEDTLDYEDLDTEIDLDYSFDDYFSDLDDDLDEDSENDHTEAFENWQIQITNELKALWL